MRCLLWLNGHNFDLSLQITVEGICDNELPAGTYSIEVYTGQCDWVHSEPTNFISGGFNSPSRLIIEEVRRDHQVNACKSMKVE